MSSALWLDAVPDLPRWVEVRSILLHGDGRVFGDPSGGVVVGSDGFTVGLVGYPGAEVWKQALPSFAEDAEALVIPEALEHASRLAPDGNARRAVLHRLDGTVGPYHDETIEIVDVDGSFLASLPAELAPEVEGSYIAARRIVDGSTVAVCGAASITETLWDVGIDTVEGHRRQGHARACYLALASHLATKGLQPVWGAYDDNDASLAMADSLGFVPVDELWVIELGSR